MIKNHLDQKKDTSCIGINWKEKDLNSERAVNLVIGKMTKFQGVFRGRERGALQFFAVKMQNKSLAKNAC